MSLLSINDSVFEIKEKPIYKKTKVIKKTIEGINRTVLNANLQSLKNSMHKTVEENELERAKLLEQDEKERQQSLELKEENAKLKELVSNLEEEKKELAEKLEEQQTLIDKMINGIKAKPYEELDKTIMNLK
jgi:hypothetical protein